ncbi:hypothetical protein [Streptomyces sp. NPDC055036]
MTAKDEEARPACVPSSGVWALTVSVGSQQEGRAPLTRTKVLPGRRYPLDETDFHSQAGHLLGLFHKAGVPGLDSGQLSDILNHPVSV